MFDEGGYYHTLNINDAADAIHENAVLINSVTKALTKAIGPRGRLVQGGETKITPIRKQQPGADPGSITN